MRVMFTKLKIGDYFYIPPLSPKAIKELEKEMNEITGYSEKQEEIDLNSKPLWLLVLEFKNKQKKKSGKTGKKWEYKYRFKVYKKISETKFEVTEFGDPHELYYPPGTKKPMVFDAYPPFMYIEKIDKEKLLNNDSCKET